MKKISFIILSLPIFLTFGCARKISENQNSITPNEQIVLKTISNTCMGKVEGPILLKHRKLNLNEIAEHLDMDEETAKLHLKATNIHGYFSLIAKNYPPGTEFILYHVDYRGKVNGTKTFYVNEYNTLVTPMDDTFIELANNFLFFSDYMPGEPVDFALGSKDGKYFAASRIVPNPIETIDEDNHKVSVEITSADRKKYLVHCTGCEPFANYMLITRFENEKFVHALEANANGEMFQLTGPTVPWVTGGDASIELRGEGFDRPLTLEYQWGA